MMRTKKMWFMAAGLLAASMLLVVGITLFSHKKTCYVSLDINPSIELEVEKGGKVVRADAANEDAAKILKELSLKGKDLEDAVEEIVKALKQNGYLGADFTNEILVSVNDNSMSEEVLAEVNAGIQTAIQAEDVKVKLVTQKINLTEKELAAAHEHKISAGKYHFIQEFMKDDDNATLEGLAKTSIQDLIAYAVQNNISLDKVLGGYQEAVEEVMESQGKTDDKDDKDDVDEKDDIDDKDDKDDVDEKDDIDDKDDKDDVDEKDDIDDKDDIEDTDDTDDEEGEEGKNAANTENTDGKDDTVKTNDTVDREDEEAEDEDEDEDEDGGSAGESSNTNTSDGSQQTSQGNSSGTIGKTGDSQESNPDGEEEAEDEDGEEEAEDEDGEEEAEDGED